MSLPPRRKKSEYRSHSKCSKCPHVYHPSPCRMHRVRQRALLYVVHAHPHSIDPGCTAELYCSVLPHVMNVVSMLQPRGCVSACNIQCRMLCAASMSVHKDNNPNRGFSLLTQLEWHLPTRAWCLGQPLPARQQGLTRQSQWMMRSEERFQEGRACRLGPNWLNPHLQLIKVPPSPPS